MGDKRLKKIFNIRFDDDIFSEISKQSEELQITETEFIRRAVRHKLKDIDEQKKNTNQILFLTSMANVYLEEILQNINFEPAKLVKSIEKIKNSLNEFSTTYGIKL